MSDHKRILPTRGKKGLGASPLASPRGWSTTSYAGPASHELPSDEDDGDDKEGKQKRNRNLVHKPAQTACTKCRQNRSKCEGPENKTCDNCRRKGWRCFYDTHSKTSQKELQLKLEQDRAQAKSTSQRVHILFFLLQIVSQDGRRAEFIEKMRREEDPRSIARWVRSLTEWRSSARELYALQIHTEDIVDDLVQFYEIGATELIHDKYPPENKWTRVTANHNFLDHLVELYLKYVNSQCTLFSEIPFLYTYRSGKGDGCNNALLNAVCAMACNILDRSDMESERASRINDLQDAFLVEAKHSIDELKQKDLTTIQAMAVTYLTEQSSGKARSANSYLGCACEYLRRMEMESSPSAYFDFVRWGIHSLEMTSCLVTHHVSIAPYTHEPSISFDTNKQFLDRYSREAKASVQVTPVEPEICIEMAGLEARLCRVISMIVGIYSGREGFITPQSIVNCYDRCLELHGNLEQIVRKQGIPQQGSYSGNLSLIKCYHVIASLWLPLVAFADGQRDKAMFDACCPLVLLYCRKGVKLLQAMIQENARATILAPYVLCAMSICDSLARWTTDGAERLSAIQTCFKLLDGNAMNARLCETLSKIFRMEMEELIEEEDLLELTQQYQLYEPRRIEETLDATTRLTYAGTLPLTQELLAKDFQVQWPEVWREMMPAATSMSGGSSPASIDAMRLENICN